ncbi:MAG TPA: prepilin-type N-terminal cleavage/methylation domain-containing protein [Candidatus Acidoferrum sp.]|nr:prepilin-type N-terminal cleavage/methylation domain-containing protein [Candidatus Acidoferrum sp.]
MNQPATRPPGQLRSPRATRSNRGFSLIEMVMVVAVGLVLAAISVPVIQSVTRTMRLNAAVSAVTGAMQSTRYRAIYDGCPYTISFFKDSDTYQLASEVTGGACAAAFTNVGTAIPFSRTSYVTLDQNLTFQFSPGGSVTVTTGASTFNLSYVGYSTTTKQVQVTKYGSITVH